MGPQQGQSGRNTQVDAIDLTLSSPEPEARPQHQVSRYPQQQQPAGAFKQEPGSSHRSAHSGNDHAQRQGSTRSGNVPQQQPRRINPQHVKQIIDTSSHRALRHIVLQLCKTSPALSGAIARGLAPHSAYAQQLIRGQQAKSQAQTQHTIKTEPRSNEQDAYERMKKRLGPSNTTQSSAARPNTHRSPAIHENRDGLRLPPSSQKAPTVKREHRASPTDSDDSTDIVDFLDIDRAARGHDPRNQITASTSSRHHSIANLSAEGLAGHQRATQYGAPDQKPKLCLQCGERFKEGDINCYFHIGHEGPARPGDIPQYTCCGKFVGEPGCNFGRHISERTGTLTNSKRPSPFPYNGSQWSKKPRVV
ncbi:hypothetical protein BU25DRAFT_414237 [Macroventuria anomochaeta]|uniref:Uncharacterized protein n=1 Tax=Macroventuria anomochaeta TaxID=301207 RepID=A0ACB6RRJ7_9PLEO|nr:uncharacterized protein BU25DRAFT_414237 [Macroventuria anomochaeta]KAF2623774.1 hypothetical protein BU25DRAFT_414237 [Macroventuria anomochaeta]